MSKRKLDPVEVTFGSVVLWIYGSISRRKKVRYCSWTVCYRANGARHRRKFADLEEAKVFADLKAREIDSGRAAHRSVGPEEIASFLRALELIKPTPIELVAAEYAESRKILGKVPITEAARYYARRHQAGRTDKHVEVIVEELLEEKRAAELSAVHLRDLEGRLGRFAADFRCSLHRVTGPEISTWIHSLGLSARSRNNFRMAIANLVAFAKANLYLPKDWDEMAAVPTAKTGRGDITIFSPEELARVLHHCHPNLLPFVAIGAFCGLRHAEIARLHWEDIGEEWLTVQAKKAKTGSRRLVPVPAVLTAWLSRVDRSSGPVVPISNISNSIKLTCAPKRANLKWKRNALRHSWISYRVALTQDVARVALEAGNSPKVIFSSYKALVTPEQAEKWFGVVPKLSPNGGKLTEAL